MNRTLAAFLRHCNAEGISTLFALYADAVRLGCWPKFEANPTVSPLVECLLPALVAKHFSYQSPNGTYAKQPLKRDESDRHDEGRRQPEGEPINSGELPEHDDVDYV